MEQESFCLFMIWLFPLTLNQSLTKCTSKCNSKFCLSSERLPFGKSCRNNQLEMHAVRLYWFLAPNPLHWRADIVQRTPKRYAYWHSLMNKSVRTSTKYQFRHLQSGNGMFQWLIVKYPVTNAWSMIFGGLESCFCWSMSRVYPGVVTHDICP